MHYNITKADRAYFTYKFDPLQVHISTNTSIVMYDTRKPVGCLSRYNLLHYANNINHDKIL